MIRDTIGGNFIEERVVLRKSNNGHALEAKTIATSLTRLKGSFLPDLRPPSLRDRSRTSDGKENLTLSQLAKYQLSIVLAVAALTVSRERTSSRMSDTRQRKGQKREEVQRKTNSE